MWVKKLSIPLEPIESLHKIVNTLDTVLGKRGEQLLSIEKI
jgi:hypothetical protein